MEKLDRQALIALVRKIMNAEGTEQEQDANIALLERSVPHPRVTDLIYVADEALDTPEEVVDAALAYVALVPPPPEEQ